MKLTPLRTAAALAVAGLLAGAASAQEFNVDCNDFAGTLGVPSPTYGAAGTPGVWNNVDLNTGSPYFLVDKQGNPTSVTMTLSGGLAYDFYFNNNNISGEDARLLEDFLYAVTADSVTINGLADGTYFIYTYALAPDDKLNFGTNVDVVGSPDGSQLVGGQAWTGSHQQGVSYAKHQVDVVNGSAVQIDLSIGITTYVTLNGLQIELAAPAGTAYCFGDGTGNFCPCAAFGAPGEGCLTTSGTGATLSGSGTATVGADTLVLSVSGGPANKPGIFFQGNNPLAGNPAGDGLLCTAGGTIRYSVNPLDATGATSQGGFGVNATSGSTKNYQYWFRDTANACGGGFNFTNGWSQPWN